MNLTRLKQIQYVLHYIQAEGCANAKLGHSC